MLFWFKKKETVVDFFTNLQFCYDAYRVDRAVKFIPEWFKRLDKSGAYSNPNRRPVTTMRTCPGFLNYFKESIAIPAWDYIHFRVAENGIDFRCDSVLILRHEREQFEGFLDSSFEHFKINTPWLASANAKTKFIQTFPTWNYSPRQPLEKLISLPGVVDFYYQVSTNINGFFKRPNPGEPAYVFSFEPGTPISFLTPLDDVKIKIKTHLVSDQEYRQRAATPSPTPGINRLKLYSTAIDKRDKNKKCPFGFN